MILKLYAKVNLESEEQMEMENTYDLGNIAKSKEWVWRNIGVPVENVNKVVEYSKAKCIVYLNGEKILVAETFEEVYDKWTVAKREYHDAFEDVDEEPTEDDLTLGGRDEDED